MAEEKFGYDVKSPVKTGILFEMTAGVALTPGAVLTAYSPKSEVRNAMPGLLEKPTEANKPTLRSILQDFSKRTKGETQGATPVVAQGMINPIPVQEYKRRTQSEEVAKVRQTEAEVMAKQQKEGTSAADLLQERSGRGADIATHRSVGSFLLDSKSNERHFLMNREDRVAMATARLGLSDEDDMDYEEST